MPKVCPTHLNCNRTFAAGRSRGDFPNRSNVPTHAQSSAGIESPRARVPLYRRMRIFSSDTAAHSCAHIEPEALPTYLRRWNPPRLWPKATTAINQNPAGVLRPNYLIAPRLREVFYPVTISDWRIILPTTSEMQSCQTFDMVLASLFWANHCTRTNPSDQVPFRYDTANLSPSQCQTSHWQAPRASKTGNLLRQLRRTQRPYGRISRYSLER